jgi:2-oxoisovalerate dehydrogenase E1 component
LVLTEEQQSHSYAESLAGRIAQHCFNWLDAPVQTMGALDLPAVPIHIELEAAMLPTTEKVKKRIAQLLDA